MVNPIYVPDDRRLPDLLRKMQRAQRDVARATGTEINRSLAQLEEAVGLLEIQTTELLARASVTQGLADLSVTANPPASNPGTANWANGERSFTPEAPQGGARYVDVSVSGEIDGSNTGGSMPRAHLMLLAGSTPIETQDMQVPAANAAGYPPNWGTTFRIGADLLLAASPAPLTLRLYVGAYYAGGSTTITLSEVSVTTRYGQRG